MSEMDTIFQMEPTLDKKIKWMLSPGALLDLRSDLDQFIDLVENMPESERDVALKKAFQQMHLQYFQMLDRAPETAMDENTRGIHVWSGWDATLLYLKTIWTEESGLAAIRQIKEFIRDSYAGDFESEVRQLTEEDFGEIINLLDVKYTFSNRFFDDDDCDLDIAIIEEEIKPESMYQSSLDENGSLREIIIMGCAKSDKQDYLQHMLLYNLGHLVHTRMMRTAALPPSYLALLEKYLGINNGGEDDFASRVFTQAFALVAAKGTRFEKTSPYHFAAEDVEKILCQYMETLLETYQNTEVSVTLSDLELAKIIREYRPLS